MRVESGAINGQIGSRKGEDTRTVRWPCASREKRSKGGDCETVMPRLRVFQIDECRNILDYNYVRTVPQYGWKD